MIAMMAFAIAGAANSDRFALQPMAFMCWRKTDTQPLFWMFVQGDKKRSLFIIEPGRTQSGGQIVKSAWPATRVTIRNALRGLDQVPAQNTMSADYKIKGVASGKRYDIALKVTFLDVVNHNTSTPPKADVNVISDDPPIIAHCEYDTNATAYFDKLKS